MVKEEVLRKKPKERIEDVCTPVDREDVLGLVGVYVDDTLVTGPTNICEGVVKALQKLWKTDDPEFLTPSTPFRFLGVKVVLTKLGLYLHQHFYVDEFLKKHVGSYGTRVRGTTAAPESFSTKSSGQPPLKPDPEDPHCSDVRVQGNEKFSILALRERCRSYPVSLARQSGRLSNAREAILENEAHKYQRRGLETGQGREGNSDHLCVDAKPGGRPADETHVATTEQRFLSQVGASYPGRLFRRSHRQ